VELSAIGRNLNQIAKAIHQRNPAVSGSGEVRAMLQVAEGLRNHFKALLKAKEQSWEQGQPKHLIDAVKRMPILLIALFGRNGLGGAYEHQRRIVG
jgi:hypothetical protein